MSVFQKDQAWHVDKDLNLTAMLVSLLNFLSIDTSADPFCFISSFASKAVMKVYNCKCSTQDSVLVFSFSFSRWVGGRVKSVTNV